MGQALNILYLAGIWINKNKYVHLKHQSTPDSSVDSASHFSTESAFNMKNMYI